MSIEDFENQLRTLMRSKPFVPFEVVLQGNRTIYVDEPAIAFGGGGAGFIGPNEEIEFFDCEQVLTFRPVQEVPAK
jgi:hypothetical protein